MERRPEFTVIAGPNGAGKSRLRFNFHEGLKNTQNSLHLFDNITFIDGNSDYGHIIALHIGKSQTHKVVDNPPLWFKEQFETLFDALISPFGV
jgi:ABC-type branched-subunit amino acid transport system ATPase component